MATTAKQNRVMIAGTEGNADYLVIAKQKGFILGIKPLLMVQMDQTQFGFRLRLQKADDAKTDIENKQGNLELMQQVFADIPWSKRSGKRFSTVLVNEIGYGVEFLDKVREGALEGFPKMVDEIKAKIAPVEIEDEDDVAKFTIERYLQVLAEIDESYAKYKKGEDTSIKKQPGIADVIAFPSKKETDTAVEDLDDEL